MEKSKLVVHGEMATLVTIFWCKGGKNQKQWVQAAGRQIQTQPKERLSNNPLGSMPAPITTYLHKLE